jgi:DNA transformation protein and related proteins
MSRMISCRVRHDTTPFAVVQYSQTAKPVCGDRGYPQGNYEIGLSALVHRGMAKFDTPFFIRVVTTMTANRQFIEFVTDILAPIGVISVRQMFGGAGVYADGRIFALIAYDRLYLKTNDAGQAAFENEDMACFTYDTKTGPGQIRSYWQIPDRLLDEPDELIEWARRSMAVAADEPVKPKPAKKPGFKSAARPKRKPA